ncbi:MAG: alpha/beta fold hydrolase [Chloroflexota bacterium]
MTVMPSTCTVSVRDGAFETRVQKAGSGSPVLYLHGAEGPLTGWPHFLDLLSAHCQIIAPDLPGFGESTGGERLEDILDLSIYLQDLLDALSLERVSIVGHDLGGMAAAELAAVADRRVTSLVLIAPLGLWADDDPILDFYATPRDDLTPLSWHDPHSAAATAVLARPETDEAAHRAGLMLNRNLAASTRFLWPIPDRGLTRRIHRVSAPTLLVWGDSDGVVPPSYGPRWQHALKDARLAGIPGAGHFPMLEQASLTADYVVPFLAHHPT